LVPEANGQQKLMAMIVRHA